MILFKATVDVPGFSLCLKHTVTGLKLGNPQSKIIQVWIPARPELNETEPTIAMLQPGQEIFIRCPTRTVYILDLDFYLGSIYIMSDDLSGIIVADYVANSAGISLAFKKEDNAS